MESFGINMQIHPTARAIDPFSFAFSMDANRG